VVDNVKVAPAVWNPKELISQLMLESQYDGGDSAATTARLLREHSLVAAESIAHLAAHAHNERVRMQAAQYIVDRVLNSALDHDLRLRQEQVAMVGQALASVVRGLGHRFDFDPESIEVKTLAHEALHAIAAKSGDG
jgi:hypothetical protein